MVAFAVVFQTAGQGIHPWKPASTNTIVGTIAAPAGHARVTLPNLSFGNWLRHLPVKPPGAK